MPNESDPSGRHEIDPNLVEIAEMMRIQDEMHEVTEHAQDRMRGLLDSARDSQRSSGEGSSSSQSGSPSQRKR